MFDLDATTARAAAGDAQAQYSLGDVYHQGLSGVPRDLAKALGWYVKAAQSGNPAAFNRLGLLAQKGEEVPQNLVKAADCFRRGAELGDAVCQYNLACCYLEGEGVSKDISLAYPWMLKAAEQAQAAAQYNIGVMLYQGAIGEPNVARGLAWLEKAAAQDQPDALYQLGLCFHYGNGVDADEMTARVFYRRATELGHIAATYSFAWMIEHGIMQGTALHQEGDPAMAAGWYARAARGGHPMAANNLGLLYAQGVGVAQEGDTAKNLFEYAISCGEDSAMFSLGLLLYRGGPGLASDLIEAMKWGLLSLHHQPQGNAQKLLETLAPKMTIEQIDEAQTRADQWQRTAKTLLWTTESKS